MPVLPEDKAPAAGIANVKPFGPLTATGAAGEVFPLPAGTQSVRGVTVRDANPQPGVYPVLGLFTDMYVLDTTSSPPTLSVNAPYTLDAGDKIEGIAFATASGGTQPGTITPGGTIGTPGILVLTTTAY